MKFINFHVYIGTYIKSGKSEVCTESRSILFRLNSVISHYVFVIEKHRTILFAAVKLIDLSHLVIDPPGYLSRTAFRLADTFDVDLYQISATDKGHFDFSPRNLAKPLQLGFARKLGTIIAVKVSIKSEIAIFVCGQ